MHVARSFGTLVEVAHLHLVAMVVMVVAMTLVACIASFFTRPPGTGSFSRAD